MWRHERASGSALAFHDRALPEPVHRAIWEFEVDRPALVLGSTQPDAVVDETAAADRGIDVVRRRSGGGAVLLVPGEALWVDVVVPRQDPLWHDDVGLAAHWLGEAWATALSELGVPSSVHRDALVRTRWSPLVCFAGVGPGEVLDEHGRKLVGIAQRRNRAGARFQCAAVSRWDPAAILALLAIADGDRDAAFRDVAAAAAPVPGDLARVAAAFRNAVGATGS